MTRVTNMLCMNCEFFDNDNKWCAKTADKMSSRLSCRKWARKGKMDAQNLEYYSALNYPMTVRWDVDDKVFFVKFPDLPGCMAHGKTPTSAVNHAQKIKKEWLKEAISSGIEIAEPTDKRLLDAILEEEMR